LKGTDVGNLGRELLGCWPEKAWKGDGHNALSRSDREINLSPHHVICISATIEAARRADKNEGAARLDLSDELGLPRSRLHSIDIKEDLESVGFKVGLDSSGITITTTAAVGNEDSSIPRKHHCTLPNAIQLRAHILNAVSPRTVVIAPWIKWRWRSVRGGM
jgi:hypothetical protein